MSTHARFAADGNRPQPIAVSSETVRRPTTAARRADRLPHRRDADHPTRGTEAPVQRGPDSGTSRAAPAPILAGMSSRRSVQFLDRGNDFASMGVAREDGVRSCPRAGCGKSARPVR
jgi:hypothetical protein